MANERVVVAFDVEVKEYQDAMDDAIKSTRELEQEAKKGAKGTETAQVSSARKRARLLEKEKKLLKQLQKAKRLAFDPATIERYNQKIAESERRVRSLGGKTESAGNKMASTFKSLAVGVGIGLVVEGMRRLATSAVMAAAEFEKVQTSYTTFLGSAAKSQALLKKLDDFSVSTPFTPEEVQNAGKSLLAFGITAKELLPTLERIGDVSSATGKDFNELSVIYGKARVQGTLFAEDINQLTEAGVPIIQEFAKQFGVAEAEVKKLGSEGLISFENLEEGFKSLTAEGGKFNNLTASLSATTAGKLSTLSGKWTEALRQMGQSLQPVTNGILDLLIGVSDVDRASEAFNKAASATADWNRESAPLLERYKELLPQVKDNEEASEELQTIITQLTDDFPFLTLEMDENGKVMSINTDLADRYAQELLKIEKVRKDQALAKNEKELIKEQKRLEELTEKEKLRTKEGELGMEIYEAGTKLRAGRTRVVKASLKYEQDLSVAVAQQEIAVIKLTAAIADLKGEKDKSNKDDKDEASQFINIGELRKASDAEVLKLKKEFEDKYAQENKRAYANALKIINKELAARTKAAKAQATLREKQRKAREKEAKELEKELDNRVKEFDKRQDEFEKLFEFRVKVVAEEEGEDAAIAYGQSELKQRYEDEIAVIKKQKGDSIESRALQKKALEEYQAELKKIPGILRSESAEAKQIAKDFYDVMLQYRLNQEKDTNLGNRITVAKREIGKMDELRDAELKREELRMVKEGKSAEEIAIRRAEIENTYFSKNKEILGQLKLSEEDLMLTKEQIFLAQNEQYIAGAQEFISTITTMFDAFAQAELAALEERQTASDEYYSNETSKLENLHENRMIRENDYKRRKEKLAADQKKADEKLEKEKAKINQKRAVTERAHAAFEVIINTAKGIMQAGANLPLAAIVAAIGAAQLATVLATPIPKYAVGTDNHPKDGLATVGEKGEETVWMPRGSKVLTAEKTKRHGEMIDAMMNNKLDSYIFSKYTGPALEQARATQEVTKYQTIYNQSPEKKKGSKVSESNDPFLDKWADKSGLVIENSDELAKSIAKALADELKFNR